MLLDWNKFTSPYFDVVGSEDIAVLVVGSCEQHAKHLPVGTDSIIGNYIARAAAEKAKKNIYLLPSIEYGFSHHHYPFKGTISLSQETLVAITKDIVEGAAKSGFRHFVLLNSHGGNSVPLGYALNEIGQKSDINLVLIKYWDFLSEKMAELRRTEIGGIGHAGEMETSLMLHIIPQLADMATDYQYELAKGNKWFNPDMFAKNYLSQYKPFTYYSEKGNIGTCEYATKEKGEVLLNFATDLIAEFLDSYFCV